ncbi:phosphomannomutase [Halothiobacillus diazotrophicus]|uniref:phosphomannomutase n=1 Tax=Halothiobacillus diazotrophicus TaxID=1860122 RepID=UPI000B10D907|nr:phosphomannomutase [Halothiobacillus diazotrophicus]
MNQKLSAIIQESEVAFGTSGARGLVTRMTDQVCFAYTAGFLNYMRSIGLFEPGMAVALAGDLRPSSPRILRACAAAIESVGGKPLFCGYIPSPALALLGLERKIPALMVTGSHIPDDRNGIKFNRPDGELLKSDEAGVLGQPVTMPMDLFDEAGMLRAAVDLGAPVDAVTTYIRRYVDFYGPAALSGLKIGVYQHSAVGRDIMVDILRELGAETLSLGRSEVFVPVDTEAIRPEDVQLAADWAREQHFDAIVSMDGDSDRPLLSDEHGQWLRGDILGILTAQSLAAEAVVTPVSSNTSLEKCGSFPQVVRTRIGSPYVVAAMTAAIESGATRVCGFEANGGFLLATDFTDGSKTLPALPTRDAVLPILAVLVASKRQSKPVSALVAALPQRFTFSDRLKEFPTALTSARIAGFMPDSGDPRGAFDAAFGSATESPARELDWTDGVRVVLSNDEVVHLRPSGNAPELRCYTEAATRERAVALCARVMAVLETWRS